MKKSREGCFLLRRYYSSLPNIKDKKENIYVCIANIDQGMLEQMVNIKAGNYKKKLIILLYNWINKERIHINEYKVKVIEKVFSDKDVLKNLIFKFVEAFELKPH